MIVQILVNFLNFLTHSHTHTEQVNHISYNIFCLLLIDNDILIEWDEVPSQNENEIESAAQSDEEDEGVLYKICEVEDKCLDKLSEEQRSFALEIINKTYHEEPCFRTFIDEYADSVVQKENEKYVKSLKFYFSQKIFLYICNLIFKFFKF